MGKKTENILISLLQITFVLTNISSFAQSYFACDSSVIVSQDSIKITSICSYKIDIRFFPEKYIDTLRRTDSTGRSVQVSGFIEYKGNTKTNTGVYRVIINSKLLEECEMLNYLPHGWYKRYARGYNVQPNICVEKIRFKNGERHGLSLEYSPKRKKIIVKEKYFKGQLIKKVERYERWRF